MYSLFFFLNVVVFLQVILAEGPSHFPARCKAPPPFVENPHECCLLPPFFAEEDFKNCGFEKHQPSKTPQHHGPPNCNKQVCMMKKYNLLGEDGKMSTEAVTSFVDKWAAENPDFEPAMASAKEKCLGRELPGPPALCEANKLVFCISSTLFMECPIWSDVENCSELKAYIQECK